jgi:hypothetical protein
LYPPRTGWQFRAALYGVVSISRSLPPATPAKAWNRLAARAKVTAPPADQDPADRLAAAEAFLSLALIDAMPPLKLSRLSRGIDVVGNG